MDGTVDGMSAAGAFASSVLDPRATARWNAVGPYYATFPAAFAFEAVLRLTRRGDRVLDPFAGRGTATFAAAASGRVGLGGEASPVGWVYAATKLDPAPEACVLRRTDEIAAIAASESAPEPRDPEASAFLRACFGDRALAWLRAARSALDWRHDRTDRTLAAIVMCHLHGDRGKSLSNQMRRAKAMAPAYMMRWWAERGMADPPDVDPAPYLAAKIRWRYRHGAPDAAPVRPGACPCACPSASASAANGGRRGSEVAFGDSAETMSGFAGAGARLLLTSPPYHGVTGYLDEQWLRLWFLGLREGRKAEKAGNAEGRVAHDRFRDRRAYAAMLKRVFAACVPALAADAAVLVRTDARRFTLDATVDALAAAFPGREIRMTASAPPKGRGQTALFGDRRRKPGEVDLSIDGMAEAGAGRRKAA